MINACMSLEKKFLSKVEQAYDKMKNRIDDHVLDNSGTCAQFLLMIDKQCFLAHIGDSRVLISRKFGLEYEALTEDHKPHALRERERIFRNGGAIYK